MGLSTALPKQSSPLLSSQLAANAQTHRVLIVEDDLPLSRFLGRELERMRFYVCVSHNGEAASRQIASAQYDLVLLDLNLPNMDGIELIDLVHGTQRHCPVLVLTARDRTEDRIRALDHGADDCLMKPFSFQEMQARIRSLLRRKVDAPIAAQAGNNGLTLNREEYRVTRGQRRIELTPREFALLECLMASAGKPVSRMVLMKEVWNIAFDSTSNIVDVYMKYLRDKIDGEGEPKLIRTVRGVGYELRNGH